jgi:dTDP-4-dehydrorhamnose reductase
MRWLVVGALGQLGRDLLITLEGHDVDAVDYPELDIRDASMVGERVRGADVVINVAAWTDVDGAETAEDAAYAVNADGPANLAVACADNAALLIHLSTDYVFDGTGTSPYAEDAPVAPRSAYGRTKAAGERAVLDSGVTGYVVRTAWLYGAGGRNFVRTMAGLARGSEDTVTVVDDQRGSPTWSRHLAESLVRLAQVRPDPGVYHVTNSGEVTWHGFARAIFAAVGADPARVLPVTTDAFPRPAHRPAYSVLGNARWRAAGFAPLPGWDEALAEAVRTEGAALLD